MQVNNYRNVIELSVEEYGILMELLDKYSKEGSEHIGRIAELEAENDRLKAMLLTEEESKEVLDDAIRAVWEMGDATEWGDWEEKLSLIMAKLDQQAAETNKEKQK